MFTLVQRVVSARVKIESETVGAIGPGLVLLVCVEKSDDESDADVSAKNREPAHLSTYLWRCDRGRIWGEDNVHKHPRQRGCLLGG